MKRPGAWRTLHARRVPVLAAPVLAAAVVGALVAPGGSRLALAGASALAAGVVLAGVVVHRRLSARVGPLVALLAVSTGFAAVSFGFAVLAPDCPSRSALAVSTRCSAAEAAQISLAALLAPLAVAVVVWPLLAALRLLTRLAGLVAGRFALRRAPVGTLQRRTKR